jgi:hypothetical protein
MSSTRRRIFYEVMNHAGTFPDGRIKMDVFFRSEDGHLFVWTPPWRAVLDFSAAAGYLEETNKPKSGWTPELKAAYSKIEQSFDLSSRIAETSRDISAMLHPLVGDITPSKLYSEIPTDLKHKSQQIFFVLSNAKDVDDFMVKLTPLVNVHRKHFSPQFRENFNKALKRLGLTVDERMNVTKI